MRLTLLSLLAASVPLTLADVLFTYPKPSDSIPAGSITVQWKDSGDTPTLAQLGTYTLTLMVGGNTDDDALQLATIGASPGQFSSGNTATGDISPGLASSLTNGFYLKIVSTAKDGGIVINYSDRFTLTGMTGTTPSNYVNAVTALGGKTAGPGARNAVRNAANPPAAGAPGAVGNPAAAAPAPAVPNAAEFNVPYNLQTGLTKYAPMQPIPPTKITQQKASPLYPTSAFNLARAPLPPASIVTTFTQPQTNSVRSMENTIAPQPGPPGAKRDMANYLARWKD